MRHNPVFVQVGVKPSEDKSGLLIKKKICLFIAYCLQSVIYLNFEDVESFFIWLDNDSGCSLYVM